MTYLMLASLDHCQPAVSKIDIYVTVVLNVATDIYLISIPAPVRDSFIDNPFFHFTIG
jgi:hypothetical protein